MGKGKGKKEVKEVEIKRIDTTTKNYRRRKYYQKYRRIGFEMRGL